ncbi:hypothetical protein KY495_19500 [Massilia sp. PAMC28688]|uniref:hypothetical protein n=1 Tax=Massilia sp. PAMC28688 TaxID=2861283 RepID=UPI001C62D1AC|nr:hypothetical protein [Massilia sp. PAMC28688]QYF92874.1 hypothetical protein KY495_19500 [Massilia sp. PAMC28688]
MQRSTKAALLSGLVFPGVGQLFLGRHARACVFLLPALAAAVYFSAGVLDPIFTIAREIRLGSMPFDPVAIELRLRENGQAVSPLMNVAALVMLAAWIGATVDAWMVGKAKPDVDRVAGPHR